MSWRSSLRIGCALDGMSWVKKLTVSSSAGSIQKAVEAAPPQDSSPSEQTTRPGTGSMTTAKPRPKPVPTCGDSAFRGRPNCARS